MHGIPAELFDAFVKAIIGALASLLVTSLFKKNFFTDP
jgi:hypothetical protein